MKQEVIVNTPYATLWYYPEAGIVHHQFHKFIHGDVFHEVLVEGLSIFKQRGAQKWLSDGRKNTALPQADIDWAQENWITPMIDSGWKYWAMVMPDTTVGKAIMKRVIESYANQGITVEIFATPEEAINWLESI